MTGACLIKKIDDTVAVMIEWGALLVTWAMPEDQAIVVAEQILRVARSKELDEEVKEVLCD